MLLTRSLAVVSQGGYARLMNYEEFLKLLPYLVTFASLIVTAILGIANYQISRGKASLEKERFANEKAMVFWDKKVVAYSDVWAAVTAAHDGYLAWQPIADDPSEALRKWAVITIVNEKGSQGEIDGLTRRVRDDPDYWLGWLIQNRKPNFPDLAAKVLEVREGFLFVAPRHREM